jgi:hypothetical protein
MKTAIDALERMSRMLFNYHDGAPVKVEDLQVDQEGRLMGRHGLVMWLGDGWYVDSSVWPDGKGLEPHQLDAFSNGLFEVLNEYVVRVIGNIHETPIS